MFLCRVGEVLLLPVLSPPPLARSVTQDKRASLAALVPCLSLVAHFPRRPITGSVPVSEDGLFLKKSAPEIKMPDLIRASKLYPDLQEREAASTLSGAVAFRM